MKKRESILTKRILAGLMLGLLLGSAFYARPAAAGEVINVVTQEDYEKVKDSNGDVKPQQSLTDNSVTIGTDGGGSSPSIGNSGNKNVYGGYSDNGVVTDNKVYISGGEMGSVYGGRSYADAATDNKVYIKSGEMDSVYGGYSDNGAVTGNSVFISDGMIMGSVYGGRSYAGAATGNTVTISSGMIKGSVYGGLGSSDAAGNKVYISGTPTFGTNTVLYGGHSDNGGDVSGNTLNIHTKGLQVANVRDFDEYNFYLQNDTKADDTLLTLTGGDDSDKITYITKSKINVVMEGVTPVLRIGDSVTLLENTNGIIADNTTDYGQEMRQGVSVVYDITTGLNEDGHKLVTTIDGSKVLEQTKSPVETQAAAAAFLNSGADLLVGSGIASMTAATSADDGAIFGAMGGGSMRYKTGSYADVKGYNLAMGFGKAVANNAGRLTFGPFIEYGKGEYTSHLDGGIRGDGNTKYYGVGFLVRQDNNSGVYYEGSLRYGRMDADYASGDLIGAGGSKVYSSYDSSSAYYGAHIGIGKVNKLNDTTKADVYAKFMYTHQNGDSVALRGEGNGEVYDFDAVDSTRVRVGARVSKAYSERGSGYAGLAYEYEFDGEAKATVLGFSTPSPSIKGSSGLLELGYILQPKGVNDPAIDINLQGWGGKKQGFTGNVNFVWKF